MSIENYIDFISKSTEIEINKIIFLRFFSVFLMLFKTDFVLVNKRVSIKQTTRTQRKYTRSKTKFIQFKLYLQCKVDGIIKSRNVRRLQSNKGKRQKSPFAHSIVCFARFFNTFFLQR